MSDREKSDYEKRRTFEGTLADVFEWRLEDGSVVLSDYPSWRRQRIELIREAVEDPEGPLGPGAFDIMYGREREELIVQFPREQTPQVTRETSVEAMTTPESVHEEWTEEADPLLIPDDSLFRQEEKWVVRGMWLLLLLALLMILGWVTMSVDLPFF